MTGRSDGSAIKALLPPSKGDPPPTKKKAKSPSTKNDPPPEESISSKSPPPNTPPSEKNSSTPSPHKNVPPPDQKVNNKKSSHLKDGSPTSNKNQKEGSENIWKAPPENPGRRR